MNDREPPGQKTQGDAVASKNRLKRIPVNLIAGSLGVGKTTAMNHLLNQRPDHERWAVLVNEYGLVGLDAALMATVGKEAKTGGVEIREVAGGCICCSAGIMFEMSLVLLLQRRPDRLLIEPTGLAALSGILDTLDRPGICEAIDVRSVLCLLDPARFEDDLQRQEVQDQIEAADILLANRSDLATSEQLERFDAWSQSLFPAKTLVQKIEQGRVPLAWLDRVKERETVVSRGDHSHGTDHVHHHDHHDAPEESSAELHCDATRPIVQQVHYSATTSTFGWVCWEGLVFDAENCSSWLKKLAQQSNVRRTKAVLKTNEGWLGFNFTDGSETVRPSGYRRDSRLEFIIDGEQAPDPSEIERALKLCLISPQETEEHKQP